MLRRSFVLALAGTLLAAPVLAHRLILAPEAQLRGRDIPAILNEILAATPVPVEGGIGLAEPVAFVSRES